MEGIINDAEKKRKIAKHKEILQNIYKFNEKMEDLAEASHLNDEAYRQLSLMNMSQYKQVKDHMEYLQNQIDTMKELYQKSIVGSGWVQQYHPQTLKKQQAEKRMRKWISHDEVRDHNQFKCECGDFISDKADGVKKHKKTDKHISGVQRIMWEKNGKLQKVAPLELCLALNSHLHYITVSPDKQKKYINKKPKDADYDTRHPRMIKNGFDALSLLMKKKYYRELGYIVYYETDTDSDDSD